MISKLADHMVDESGPKYMEENMRPYEQKYLNQCYQSMQEEHDACGIGLVVNIDGKKEYRTLDDALSIVEKLEHRAGKDASGEVGDVHLDSGAFDAEFLLVVLGNQVFLILINHSTLV